MPNDHLIQANEQFANGNVDLSIEILERHIFCQDFCRQSLDLWLHILNDQGRLDYAFKKLSELITRFPDCVEFHFGLGTVSANLNNWSQARLSYERAIFLSPTNFRIINILAKLELVAGNVEKAQFLARQAIELNNNIPDAHRIIGLFHDYKLYDHEYTNLIKSSNNAPNYTDAEKVQMYSALAKAAFDLGSDDDAFGYLYKMGEIHHRVSPYDRSKSAATALNLCKYVTSDNLSATNDHGCNSNLPIFIIGMPRSGTTLMEQILASHPSVFGAGELNYISQVVEGMRCGRYRLRLGQQDSPFSNSANASWSDRGQAYVDYLNSISSAGCERVVDKMPANYQNFGMIRSILPNAPIIHMLRHPMEVCFSCYKTPFTQGQEWSYRLEDIAFQYRQYWNVMSHWRKEFPASMLELHYENLVTNPELTSKKVLQWVGLNWDNRCLNFHELNRPVKTASASQVRKPIYLSAMNRWQKYEKYLRPLVDELGDIIAEYETMLQNSRNNA